MEKPARTMRYVAVLEGEGPGTSRPILATADPGTVDRVLAIIRERLGEEVSQVAVNPHTDGGEL